MDLQVNGESGNRAGDEVTIEAPRGMTLLGILYRTGLGATAIAVILLFVAVISSPVASALWGGLAGSAAVIRYSVLAGLLAAQTCVIYHIAQDSRKGVAWPVLSIFILFLITVNLFVHDMQAPRRMGMVSGHDDPQYFAYLHSWVFDRDLRFENEYARIPGAIEIMEKAHGGQADWNVAPIGSAIIWLPFYLLTHGAVYVLKATGVNIVPDGLSPPYAAGVAFGTITAVCLGLGLIFDGLRRIFSTSCALLTVVLLLFATNLQWYTTFTPWMSHACSFFAGALVFWIWIRAPKEPGIWCWPALGAAIGFAMLVRPAHAVLIVLPVISLAAMAIRGGNFRRSIAGLVLCILATLIVFSPQLATWALRSGTSLPPGGKVNWIRPEIANFLFSGRNGMVVWQPVTLLGLVGMLALLQSHRRVAIGVASVVILSIYVNSAIFDWWAGASFGARRMIGVLPFVAAGIAAFGTWLAGVVRKHPWIGGILAAAVFVAYNQLVSWQYRYNWVGADKPKDFGTVWRFAARTLHERVGNPLAFPASIPFALRHGASPAQYDFLSGVQHDLHLVDAKSDQLFWYLGRGWDYRALKMASANKAYRAGKEASLLLPMSSRRGYLITLTGNPPMSIEKAPTLTFLLNGTELGEFTLAVGKKSDIKIRVPAGNAVDGINILSITSDLARRVPGQSRKNGLPVATAKDIEVAFFLRGIKTQVLAP